MKSQEIEKIRKRFHNEWLLIAIDRMDQATTTPLTGRLLAHSKNRDEIYKKQLKDKRHLLILYSEEGLPKGYAAAFDAHLSD